MTKVKLEIKLLYSESLDRKLDYRTLAWFSQTGSHTVCTLYVGVNFQNPPNSYQV